MRGVSTSRILVIGGTGMMGRHLVNASLAAGHPTTVLVRPATAGDPAARMKLLEAFKDRGANIVYGDLNDHEILVAACKEADIVISGVGHHGADDQLGAGQLKILAAIKEAGGNVKRFVPSEYGVDVDQIDGEALTEPARSMLLAKVRTREAVRASGIPHTFFCSYWTQWLILPRLGDPQVNGPPATTATIFGDENTRVIFVNEVDMGKLVIKAVEDPRTLNKILYVRPPASTCSFSHLVTLWEDKTGKTLDRCYVPEEELVKRIHESPFPLNLQLAMVHATVAAGVCDQTINASVGVEATKLYPDTKYITVHDYLDDLVVKTITNYVSCPIFI